MILTDFQIKEIAEHLESGEQCYVHRHTGEIEHYPDPILDNEELWQDLIEKIENNRRDYVGFEKMLPYQSFHVMENFVGTLLDQNLKRRLEYALYRKKPFAHFKYEVDNSAYRQAWFAFRANAYVEWVKKQLDLENGLAGNNEK